MPKINDVNIDDTFIESSEIISSEILVTSITKEVALANAQRLCRGIITFSPIEGFLGNFVSQTKTPDKRPGFLVLLRGNRSMNVETKDGRDMFDDAFTNVLCQAPHLPTVAVFNAVPKAKTLFTSNSGEKVRRWGDGYEIEGFIGGRKIYRIPVMTGESVVERSFGLTTSFDGAFEVFCQDISCALLATRTAAERVQDEVEGAFVMHPFGGVNGAKTGGVNYIEEKATSTTFLCPTIRDRVAETRVPPGVNTVIEYLIWGLDLETVKKGLSVSLNTITAFQGIIGISGFNQGGHWGKNKIYLRELVEDSQKTSDDNRRREA
jgi:formylmethanofuran--tetrahydromethanopterin N-formyltransferase